MLLGDIGGYIGLLLGASVLTVIELLDLIIYNGIRKMYARTVKHEHNGNCPSDHRADNSSSNLVRIISLC